MDGSNTRTKICNPWCASLIGGCPLESSRWRNPKLWSTPTCKRATSRVRKSCRLRLWRSWRRASRRISTQSTTPQIRNVSWGLKTSIARTWSTLIFQSTDDASRGVDAQACRLPRAACRVPRRPAGGELWQLALRAGDDVSLADVELAQGGRCGLRHALGFRQGNDVSHGYGAQVEPGLGQPAFRGCKLMTLAQAAPHRWDCSLGYQYGAQLPGYDQSTQTCPAANDVSRGGSPPPD